MNNKIKFLLIGSLSLFVGCQTTSAPDWYTTPNLDNSSLVSVGQGRSLKQAKLSAIDNINASLWTQIESTFSGNDSYREVNGESVSSQFANNKVNSQTTSITFNNVEFTQSEKSGDIYFVQAKIAKQNVINQLINDIEQVNSTSLREIEKYPHSDALLWWLNNRKIEQEFQTVAIRSAILESLGVTTSPDITNLEKRFQLLTEQQSKLLISIKSNKNNRKSAQLLAELLTQEGVATTRKRAQQRSHTLTLTSDVRENEVGDAFVSTMLTSVELSNKQGKTLTESEIISTGNSLTNFRYAREGAERHFADQIGEQGVWTSLGLK